MRYVGLLLTLVIICVVAIYIFRSVGLSPSGDQRDVNWYYDHPTERADKLKWCNENPQQQDSSECSAAVAAQTRADVEKVQH